MNFFSFLFSPLMATRHKVHYSESVKMFSKTCHTGSVLLHLMSAVKPPLIENKLIHMTLQKHKLYALFVAKPLPSPLHHKLCGKLNNSLPCCSGGAWRWRRLVLCGSVYRARATSVRLGSKPRKRLTEYPLQGMKIMPLQLAKYTHTFAL